MRSVFAAVSGGLGADQTGDIQTALKGMTGVRVWSPGAGGLGNNDYQANFASAVMIAPADIVVLIGHSYGCDAIVWAAKALFGSVGVDLAVFAAPVLPDKTPVNCRRVMWLDPSSSFLPRGKVIGAVREEIATTDHNSICHAAETIQVIGQAVRELRDGGIEQ